jgi:hypothetical protein
MQKSLRLMQKIFSLLGPLALATTLFAYSLHGFAEATATTPVISISSTNVQLAVNHCITLTVRGKNFESNGQAGDSATFSANTGSNDLLMATPTIVAVGVEGNFDTYITVCGLVPDPTETMTLTASDAASGLSTAAQTITVVAPVPTLNITTQTTTLWADCATITVPGQNFIPSGKPANYAYIYAVDAVSMQQLSQSPAQINVLGGGNIVANVRLCGLKAGQQFVIYASDGGSIQFSNPVTLKAT